MILWGILTVVLYAAACVFLGLLAIRLVVGTDAFRGGLTPVAKTASAFLLGSGLLASVWLLVSLTPDRWFTPWVVTIVVGAALGLGVWDGLPLLRDTARQIGRAVAGAIRQLPWTWKIVVAVTAGLIAYYGLTCFLPPKGDAAAFYAALPKVIAHQWRLVILPGWRFWTVIGLHGEFHAAVFHLWGAPVGATLFLFPTALAGLAMLTEIARECGLGRRGQWVLLCLAVTSSAATAVIPGGKVDWFGCALGLGAVFWALQIGRRGWLGPVVMAGLLAGWAVVAKMSLLGTVVPMVGLLALWRAWTSERPPRLAGIAVCIGLIVCAVAAAVPHLLKNAVLFGQPLAPFVGDDAWTTGVDLMGDAAQKAKLARIYPLALSLGQFPGTGGAMSAAALALWPLVILLPRPAGRQWLRSSLVAVTVAAGIALLLWATLQLPNFSLRYFLPPLLVLLIAPARAAEHVCGPGKDRSMLGVGVMVCLLMALAATCNRPRGHGSDAVAFICGLRSEADVGDTCARQAEAVNAAARSGERVYLAGYYGYFLRPDLLGRANSQDDQRRLKALPDSRHRWVYLWDNGFRYVMVEAAFLSPAGRNAWRIDFGGGLRTDELPAGLALERIYEEVRGHGPYHVYRMKYVADEPQ